MWHIRVRAGRGRGRGVRDRLQGVPGPGRPARGVLPGGGAVPHPCLHQGPTGTGTQALTCGGTPHAGVVLAQARAVAAGRSWVMSLLCYNRDGCWLFGSSLFCTRKYVSAMAQIDRLGGPCGWPQFARPALALLFLRGLSRMYRLPSLHPDTNLRQRSCALQSADQNQARALQAAYWPLLCFACVLFIYIIASPLRQPVAYLPWQQG
jgi:hypothetical protein